jgi:hypothetical protein
VYERFFQAMSTALHSFFAFSQPQSYVKLSIAALSIQSTTRSFVMNATCVLPFFSSG